MSEYDSPTKPATTSVAEYYDRNAESWDEVCGVGRQNPRFYNELRRQIRHMLSGIPADARTLELGAGTGAYVGIIAPLVGHLTATDLSKGMLAVFNRRLEALGIENVTLSQQDACDLAGIASESVDAVYSMGLLETIPNLELFFDTSHRVLKPGGLIAGITSNGECPWYVVRRRIEGGERHGRTSRLPDRRTLTTALSQSGFTDLQFIYWGAVPPGLQNGSLAAIFTALGSVVSRTPFARYLGALTFHGRKA